MDERWNELQALEEELEVEEYEAIKETRMAEERIVYLWRLWRDEQVKRKGFTLSFTDLADLWGFSSKGAVQRWVEKMETYGLAISQEYGQSGKSQYRAVDDLSDQEVYELITTHIEESDWEWEEE
jgi:hypothetical protein